MATAPALPPAPSINPADYLSIAQQRYQPVLDTQLTAQDTLGQAEKTSIASQIADLQKNEGLRVNQYNAASAIFEDSAKQALAQQTNVNTQNMGGLVASSNTGVLAAQGASRAPLTAEQNAETNATQTLVNSQQDQRNQLLANLQSDLQGYQSEIDKATSEGNIQTAQIATAKAQLTSDYLDKEMSYAGAMASAATQYEQFQIQEAQLAQKTTYDNAMLGLKADANRIAQEKVDQANAPKVVSDAIGNTKFQVHGSNVTAIEFLQQKNGSYDSHGNFIPADVDPREVATLLGQQKDPVMKKDAKDIINAINSGPPGSSSEGPPDPSLIIQYLQGKYPEYFGES